MGIGEGQDDHYNLSLNGDSCIISREMDKKKLLGGRSLFLLFFLDQNPESMSEFFHSLNVWHKSCKLTAKLTSVRLHNL